MTQTVTVENTFSGPLDLLLHLVKRDEIDIHDIPIARLTKAYLEEMAGLNLIDVDAAADFLDMASRLAEIKSRLLLPPDELDRDGEEEAELDPRTGLVEALLEYKRFKDIARLLGSLAEEQAGRFPRVPPPLSFPGEAEEAAASLADSAGLMEAFRKICERLLRSDAVEIVNVEVPTEKRIEQLSWALENTRVTRFSLLLSSRPKVEEIVGFFIALLEMIRQGKVIARQAEDFSDIVIEIKEKTATPEPAVAIACPLQQKPALRHLPLFMPVRTAIVKGSGSFSRLTQAFIKPLPFFSKKAKRIHKIAEFY